MNSITNSMISNGHSLTIVINTIFAIFNSIGISKNSSNQVFIRFQNSFTTGQSQIEWRIESQAFLQMLQRSDFFIPILTKNVFVGKALWRSLYWNFFSFESFVGIVDHYCLNFLFIINALFEANVMYIVRYFNCEISIYR